MSVPLTTYIFRSLYKARSAFDEVHSYARPYEKGSMARAD